MRANYPVKIEAKTKDNTDFGRRSAPPEVLYERAYVTFTDKGGRVVRKADQLVATDDVEMVTSTYLTRLHKAWQDKREITITDQWNDKYGVKSLRVDQGRHQGLRMGCVRA